VTRCPLKIHLYPAEGSGPAAGDASNGHGPELAGGTSTPPPAGRDSGAYTFRFSEPYQTPPMTDPSEMHRTIEEMTQTLAGDSWFSDRPIVLHVSVPARAA
jgi:hypothetical protein